MKITDVRTMVVENEPMQGFAPTSSERSPGQPRYVGGKHLLFLELVTDEGIIGLGERVTGNGIGNSVEDMKSQIALIHEIGRQYLIGENPFNVELIWQKVFGDRHDFRHPSLHATPALSAVEMACWDIIGKATNQPIYNLLGGMYHEKLKAYAYMPAPEGGYRNNPELA